MNMKHNERDTGLCRKVMSLLLKWIQLRKTKAYESEAYILMNDLIKTKSSS